MPTSKRGRLLQSLTGLLAPALLLMSPTWAQKTFPSQPIKIVVGSEAGSAPDVLARTLAKEMEPLLKQAVIIENRAGAAGTVGAAVVAQSPPDGHTLLMGTVSNIALAASFYPVKYKATESFTPIGMVASVPLVLVSSSAVGAADYAQLRSRLAQPETARNFAYASPGMGGPQHLAGVLLERQFGLKLLHVPYKSGGAAMTAVAGGETQIAFAGIPAAIPLLQGKRVVPMFVTSPRRSPALPEVPSAAEVGLPTFEVDNWHAVFAPSGLPSSARSTLESALRTALQAPSVKAEFMKLGAEPMPGTGAELADKVAREETRWSALVKDAGLQKAP